MQEASASRLVYSFGSMWLKLIPGALFQYKDSITMYRNSPITRSWDRLIFIMGVPILVRLCLYIETDRRKFPYELVIEKYLGYDELCIILIYVINYNVDTSYHGVIYWVKMFVCIYFGRSYSYLESKMNTFAFFKRLHKLWIFLWHQPQKFNSEKSQ